MVRGREQTPRSPLTCIMNLEASGPLFPRQCWGLHHRGRPWLLSRSPYTALLWWGVFSFLWWRFTENEKDSCPFLCGGLLSGGCGSDSGGSSCSSQTCPRRKEAPARVLPQGVCGLSARRTSHAPRPALFCWKSSGPLPRRLSRCRLVSSPRVSPQHVRLGCASQEARGHLSANSQKCWAFSILESRWFGRPSPSQEDAERLTSQRWAGTQDQFRLKPLDSMTASRSLSSSFSRSRCSSSRATRESLCSTTSSISFRIFFSSDSSSSVFR